VTERWRSEPDDSPRRDLFDLRCIAEIASRFDVVAIEEAREDLSALRLVLEALGDTWGLIATDVTRGRAGNSERLVFVFDTRRVKPSGLAGELVVAIEEETDLTATILDRQFARTPYAVSFQARAEELTLVTLHVIWGDDEQKRADELKEIATWLADWPNRESTCERSSTSRANSTSMTRSRRRARSAPQRRSPPTRFPFSATRICCSKSRLINLAPLPVFPHVLGVGNYFSRKEGAMKVLATLVVMGSVAVASLMMSASASAAPHCHGLTATMTGTSGSDNIVGTNHRDVIVARAGHDIVRSRGGRDVICAGRGDDGVAAGARHDRVYGGRGADDLRGNNGADRLFGQRGFDRFLGGRGNDFLSGGFGTDEGFGGLGTDTCRSIEFAHSC
jgi:hypothetical protein